MNWNVTLLQSAYSKAMRFCLQLLNAKDSPEENFKENIERKRTGDYQAKQLV